LSWSDTGLYACGSFTGEEAFVHRSLDVGERFEGLFWKSQLEGATGCGLDTAVGSLCDAAWPAIAASLGTPMLPPEPPGSGQGGSGDSGPDGDAEPEPPGSQSRASDGGCSVGSGNRPARASWPSLASALLAACAVLRRARLPSPGRSPTREH